MCIFDFSSFFLLKFSVNVPNDCWLAVTPLIVTHAIYAFHLLVFNDSYSNKGMSACLHILFSLYSMNLLLRDGSSL